MSQKKIKSKKPRPTLAFLNALYYSLERVSLHSFMLILIYCFFYETLLTRKPAPYLWMVGVGRFIIQILYGFITGYIFYIITVSIPATTRKIKLVQLLSNSMFSLQNILMVMFRDIGCNDVNEAKLYPNDNQLIENLKRINPNKTFRPKMLIGNDNDSRTFNSYFEYYNWRASKAIGAIDLILSFKENLSDSSIGHLTKIRSTLTLNQHYDGIALANKDIEYMIGIYSKLSEYAKELYYEFYADFKHTSIAHSENERYRRLKRN